MSPLDITVLVVYLAFIGGLAFHFSRRQKSAEDYFLAGRNLPGWVVGFSLMGTVVSSATFVGHPGNVFFSDMWPFAYHLGLPVVVLLTVGRFVVFYRRTLRMSPYEYLGTRFGYPAQAYASVSFILSRVLDMSLTVYFLGLALAFVTGWDVWWVILAVGLLTVIYTLAGGIQGVVWTDFLQGILLVGGGLLCCALILGRGDSGQLLTTAWEGGKFSLGNWAPSLIEDNFWLLFVGGIFHFLQAFGTDQNMVQRYLLARSDREARRSAMTGILSCIPIWLLFMLLGALLWAFYQADPSALPPEVGEVKDNIIPHFIMTELPPGLLGLLLAGLLAAAMSSMDSDLNSIAAVVLQNFYRRYRPGAIQRRQLMVGRAGVVVGGLLSIFLAQQWIGIESLVKYSLGLALVVSGGKLGLFALGWLFPKATSKGAYTGLTACVLFTLWAALTRVEMPNSQSPLLDLGPYNFPWMPMTIGMIGHVLVLVVGYAASREKDGAGSGAHPDGPAAPG